MTHEEIKKMPKIELHCHLDGSLSQAYLEGRLNRHVSREEMSVSDDCRSLQEYLEKFGLPCSCLMDEEGLEKAGMDVLCTMHEENVVYAEIRFAPLLSVTENMDCKKVISALLRGLEKGKEIYGVSYQVIICLMRHHSFGQNLTVLEAAKEFLGKGVCAADLAGAEALYPMAQFMDLFCKAKEMGFPFTIHAGECGSVENILDSIQVGASRIGHGIAMRGNSQVQRMVKERKIGIEMCPISNLQTKSVKDPSEYPIREFLEKGLLVTVNTDNRTVSNSSLTKELEFIQRTYGISDMQVIQAMRNAIDTAFLNDEEKARLSCVFEEALK